MSQSWYAKHGEKIVGPITVAQLKQLAGSGRISPETQLRLGDDGKWLAASKVKGLLARPKVDRENTTTSQLESEGSAPIAATTELQHKPPGSLTTSEPRPGSDNPYGPPTSLESHQVASPKDTNAEKRYSIRKALLTIWFQPRKTIRWAIDHRPQRDAMLLVMAAFCVKYFDNALSSESTSLAVALTGSIIGLPVSALIGIVVLYFFGFLHKTVGEAVGGRGTYGGLRTAFAWSSVPMICSFPITLIFLVLLAAFPKHLFIPDAILTFPFVILSAWGIIIEVAGISAAHEFSILRAIVTFVLSVLIVVLAISIAVLGTIMLMA